jgi:hypothetical protein
VCAAQYSRYLIMAGAEEEMPRAFASRFLPDKLAPAQASFPGVARGATRQKLTASVISTLYDTVVVMLQ